MKLDKVIKRKGYFVNILGWLDFDERRKILRIVKVYVKFLEDFCFKFVYDVRFEF